VRDTRRPAARAHAHEALLRFPVDGLRADVARLTRRVVRAFLGGLREELLVLFLGVIRLGAAALLYLFT